MKKPILGLPLALFTFLILFPLSFSQADISQWPGLKELFIDRKTKKKGEVNISR